MSSRWPFVAMVWLGMPKKGASPSFMRNGFMETIYPLGCLLVFVARVAGILSGLSSLAAVH